MGRCNKWGNPGVGNRSLLFIIYINDLDINLKSHVAIFADDTKLGYRADAHENSSIIQGDINKATEWAKQWQMEFNIDKCKVMHIGSKNVNFEYNMTGNRLEIVTTERDLGVLISNKFKTSDHCIKTENICNRLLGYIKRQFNYRNREVVTTLYKSLILPYLEYAVSFWSPSLERDVNRLERIQARATKLIPELRHRPYRERIKELGLMTVKQRRERIDLIQVYKILNKIDNVSANNYFELCDNPTRNNGHKIKVKRYNTSILGNSFTYRVVNKWNSLSAEIVNSETLTNFKTRLDKLLISEMEENTLE
jgi:hypothetical protein